jgi:shikimate dehydrogenase
MNTDTAGRFAVFGHPIAHSLSPRIHARFAATTGIRLSYAAIDAPAESFATQLADFAAAGGRGANVTLPLMQDACALSAALSISRAAPALSTR